MVASVACNDSGNPGSFSLCSTKLYPKVVALMVAEGLRGCRHHNPVLKSFKGRENLLFLMTLLGERKLFQKFPWTTFPSCFSSLELGLMPVPEPISGEGLGLILIIWEVSHMTSLMRVWRNCYAQR